jgi:hypothetical protein
MIPISFLHAPTPVKPSAKASEQELAEYRLASRLARLSLRASQQIASLRQSLDADPGGSQRPLHLFVDGGYTNATVLKPLPANTVLVGRIRKDAKLYWKPVRRKRAAARATTARPHLPRNNRAPMTPCPGKSCRSPLPA